MKRLEIFLLTMIMSMILPAEKPITHVLYLHGFRSSPQSAKAQTMASHMATNFPQVHWWCPQLPASPREAFALIEQGTASWPEETTAVIGSSLGGFYATALAEQRGCKAVLLNPAVEPARDLEKYIGEQTSWHDPKENFFFEPAFVQELRTLTTANLSKPSNYLAIIAKGDEVLNWREMQARYAGAQICLLEGGDHALSDFDVHLPAVMAFLDLI